MSSPKTILITGANRGIGFAILQALATRTPSDHYILACRSASKGEESISQLRGLGIQSEITTQALDVTSDDSIRGAVQAVASKFGHLDVLINNAGIGIIPQKPDMSDLRDAWNTVYNTNVSSIAVTSAMFLPLLRKSPLPAGGLIINVSSARGSLTLGTTVGFPPTISIPYSISKTALNALTIELSKTEQAAMASPDAKGTPVRFHAVSPGHCKTEFNNFKGKRDPLDGAKVVVELVNEPDKEKYGMFGFWALDDGDQEPQPVPW